MPPFPLFNKHLCCHFLPHPSWWVTAQPSCTSLHLSLSVFSVSFYPNVCMFVPLQCAHVIYSVYMFSLYSVWMCIPQARSSLIQNCDLCLFFWGIHCLCIMLLLCLCVCLTASPWVSPWVYFLRVCVPVCCMQPCEAVCLLAASRLVFPKHAGGFWLRFIYIYIYVYMFVCVRACVHLFGSMNVQGQHTKLSLAVIVWLYLCVNQSICLHVHLSVSFILHLVITWLPVILFKGKGLGFFPSPGPALGSMWARSATSVCSCLHTDIIQIQMASWVNVQTILHCNYLLHLKTSSPPMKSGLGF